MSSRATPASRSSVAQGTLSPLLGIGVCVSIQFGAVEATKRWLAKRNVEAGRGGPDGKMLSGGQLVAAGVAAGLSNGVVSGPVEHIRIRKYYSAHLTIRESTVFDHSW